MKGEYGNKENIMKSNDLMEKEKVERCIGVCENLHLTTIHRAFGGRGGGDAELMGLFAVYELFHDIFSLALENSDTMKDIISRRLKRLNEGNIEIRPDVWKWIVEKKRRSKREIDILESEAVQWAKKIMLLNGDMERKLNDLLKRGYIGKKRKMPFICMKSICVLNIDKNKNCDDCAAWEQLTEASEKMFEGKESMSSDNGFDNSLKLV